MDEKSKGADVLPFGLTTDVSANALTAGAGGMPGAGLATVGAGPGAGFEQELSAFAQASEVEEGSLIASHLQSAEAGLSADILPGGDLPELVVQAPALPETDLLSKLTEGSATPAPVTDGSVPVPLVEEFAEEIATATPTGAVDLNNQDESPAVPSVAASTEDGIEDPLEELTDLEGTPAPQEASDPDAVPVPIDEPKIVGAAGLAIGLQGRSTPVPAVERANASATGRAHGAPFVLASETADATMGQSQVSGAGSERKWQSELPTELRAPIVSSGPALSDPLLSPQISADALLTAGTDTGSVKPETVTLASQAPASMQMPLEGATPELAPLQDAEAVETVPAASKSAPAPQITAEINTVTDNEQTISLAGAATAKPGAGATSSTVEAGTTPIASTTAAAAPNLVAPETPDGDGLLMPKPGAEEANGGAKQTAQAETDTLAGEKTAKGPDQSNGASPPAGANAAAADKAGAASVPLVAALPASQMINGDIEFTLNPAEFAAGGELGATVRGGELTGAMRTESLQTPTQSQSGQVATQVAAEIARNLKNGSTRFQMRFDPPELGRVEVNMRVAADGSVQAHLIVERPETLDMFMRDQRGLERALEAAGLNADSENLQFSLKQEGGQGFASEDGQSEQSLDGEQDHAGSGEGELSAEAEEIIRLTLAEQRGGLDVKI
ncbi:Flagellar hook-length control protein FliK [Roseibium album]|nr:Flagellar hook-length control protein FliK [Roseibium album]